MEQDRVHSQSRMARISRPSGDVEVPPGRKDFRDSLCPVPGCGTWTRKMKDHAFKSHLSHFFKLPDSRTAPCCVLSSHRRVVSNTLQWSRHAGLLRGLTWGESTSFHPMAMSTSLMASVPGAWLWHVDPEIEGPCLQGSPVPVFSGPRQGDGCGQSSVPSAAPSNGADMLG
jgi:hypothetical protein